MGRCNGAVTPETALIAAGGLHLGFQAVVTVVVYPALATTRPADWADVHAAHSRRISLVVGPLYVAVAGHTVAAGATALSAAPTHGRLGRTGPDPRDIARLLRADRVRLAGTVVAFAAALLTV